MVQWYVPSVPLYSSSLGLHWVFVAALGFSLAAVSRGYSLVAVRGLTAVASLIAEHRL